MKAEFSTLRLGVSAVKILFLYFPISAKRLCFASNYAATENGQSRRHAR
jgi:hypothetical protein